MAFTIQKLDDCEKLGEQLYRMRKACNWTLNEMAESTKIQRYLLEAFEKGDYDKLPESLYARQFLKRYVRALGGNEDDFLHRFDQERGTCDFYGNTRMPIKKTKVKNFFSFIRVAKIGGLSLIVACIGIYIGWQVITITTPPRIVLESPLEDVRTNNATIAVSGITAPETKLSINGVPVLLNTDGHFNVPIALERGINVIAVEGATRHSRSSVVYRRVIFDESATEQLSQR